MPPIGRKYAGPLRPGEHSAKSTKEELDFTQMGYDAGSSPTLIRAHLSNCVGLDTDRVCTVVGSIKNGSTDPTFTRRSYNQKANLRDSYAYLGIGASINGQDPSTKFC